MASPATSTCSHIQITVKRTKVKQVKETNRKDGGRERESKGGRAKGCRQHCLSFPEVTPGPPCDPQHHICTAGSAAKVPHSPSPLAWLSACPMSRGLLAWPWHLHAFHPSHSAWHSPHTVSAWGPRTRVPGGARLPGSPQSEPGALQAIMLLSSAATGCLLVPKVTAPPRPRWPPVVFAAPPSSAWEPRTPELRPPGQALCGCLHSTPGGSGGPSSLLTHGRKGVSPQNPK